MASVTRAVPREARRARIAVGALFFCNAVIYANVVPRFPEVKAALDLSNSALGVAIAAGPVGALVAGTVMAHLVRRFGSARVGVISTAVMAVNLVFVGFSSSWLMLAAALMVAGMCDAISDIAINAHGLRVQRLYGRSILNSFHGIWSIGAVLGGLMGAAAAGLRIPLPVHLSVVGAAMVVVALLSYRLLLTGSDAEARAEARRVAGAPAPGARSRASAVGLLVALGAIGALGFAMEDAGASWSAVYLSGSLGAAPLVAGLGFVSLQAFQTLGRLTGDAFVNRFGDRAVAITGAVLAGGGMAFALLLPSIPSTIVGFGCVGLGIGTLIPAATHAADSLPGLREGVGLTVVSMITRVGGLASPPVIGVIADATTLRIALFAVPFAAAAVVALSFALKSRSGGNPAEGTPGDQPGATPLVQRAPA
ncbi:MFS transporter [Planctomonas psychrotolerans]|uniref:MFS transporter n=1 Tax=Planctomonas psychrotolerans TaxID=2528712 RepID=UPI00123B5574|nr:MFS transporter [Planctomonas psychrotolerans]